MNDRFLVALAATVAMSLTSVAQERGFRLEVSGDPAFVIQGNGFFRGMNWELKPVTGDVSLNVRAAFRFAPSSEAGRSHPYAWQGIGLGWNRFSYSAEIGNPLMLYVFQQNRMARLGRWASLDYRWSFGISGPWKKYDRESNFYNNVVGSRLNAYLNLGAYLRIPFGSGSDVSVGAFFSHFSNGNTHYPNRGVNIVGASLGVSRAMGRVEGLRVPDGSHDGGRVMWDLSVWGAPRFHAVYELSYPIQGQFAVIGLSVNSLYEVSRLFRFGVALDAEWDEGASLNKHVAGYDEDDDIVFVRPPLSEQVFAGLSARGEIVMPVFTIGFGIGHPVLWDSDDFDGWYQILVLKTAVTRRLYLHTGYSLSDFKDPRHLMFGMGCRL